MRPGGADVGGSHPSDSDEDRARVTKLGLQRSEQGSIILFSAKANENMGLGIEKAYNNNHLTRGEYFVPKLYNCPKAQQAHDEDFYNCPLFVRCVQ